jgi:hypothetical protein
MKPNLPYHSARLEGRIARDLYRAALAMIVRRRVRVPRELPFEVFAYSGENNLPEQVASIRSFLTNAGRPKQFTVVSDGSYSDSSLELLQKIDNCVRVERDAPPLPAGLPENVHSRLTEHFTGKQLALIMSLPANGPTLYTDADVLFFPEAKRLADLSRTQSVSAFYLADYQFSADERLIRDAIEREKPVNMGFLFLFQKLDWSLGLERLKMLTGIPNFFTTQTAVHLCMHANGARPFDPQRFILQADDEFIYRDMRSGPSIAIRHYVNPVRHKFWAAIAHQLFH